MTATRILALGVVLGAAIVLAGCVAPPAADEDGGDGGVFGMGQICSTTADCSSDLRCLSTRVGRVCVETCLDVSECSQSGAVCSPIPGVNAGFCDAFGTPDPNNPIDNPPMDTPPVDNPPADNPPIDNPPMDTPPDDEPPVGPRATYPAGPYGTAIGDTIEDLSMLDTNGNAYSLSDLYADESVKMLIIFNTVAYCQSCAAKTADLTALQSEFGTRGLVPVLPLFENLNYQPASPSDAAQYKQRLNLQFPVVADGSGVFHRYFPELAHPLVMVIDVETMTILYKEISWIRSEVEPVVRGRL